MDGEQAGYSRAFGKHTSYQMTRTFGRNHENIDISCRLDLAKVNVESVGESQCRTGPEIGGDLFAIGRCLFSSGMSIMTTSAQAVASATVATLRPAVSAFVQDLLPS